MVNRAFYDRLAVAFGDSSGRLFDLSTDEFQESTEKPARKILISSYILAQLTYRFGHVFFALIQTMDEPIFGLMLPPYKLSHVQQVNWQKTGTCYLKSGGNSGIELPLMNALSVLDMRSKRLKKAVHENERYSYNIDIVSKTGFCELLMRGPTEDRHTNVLWHTMRQTLKSIAQFIDSEDSRYLLENYAKYLDES